VLAREAVHLPYCLQALDELRWVAILFTAILVEHHRRKHDVLVVVEVVVFVLASRRGRR
jgi:hypothetical protein